MSKTRYRLFALIIIRDGDQTSLPVSKLTKRKRKNFAPEQLVLTCPQGDWEFPVAGFLECDFTGVMMMLNFRAALLKRQFN
jgi:hypothetical protein